MTRLPILLHAGGAGLSLRDLVSLGVIALVITTASIQIASSLLRRRGRLAPPDRPFAFATCVRVVAAACSLGAAVIHLAVIGDHLEQYAWFGLAFAVLATFQVAWSIAYVMGPSPALAAAAILVNVGTPLVWLWSRTIGLPVGPNVGVPEAVGTADLISTVLELALVCVLLVASRPGARRLSDRLHLSPTGALIAGGYSIGAVALATVVALLSLSGPA